MLGQENGWMRIVRGGNMKKITFRFLSFVFLFCLLTQPALAQFAKGGEGKYLILGTTSKTVGYMGPWVAKRKGRFFLTRPRPLRE